MSNDAPKIIIDEDWKSQVQKEKEQAKQPDAIASEGSGAAVAPTDASQSASSSPEAKQQQSSSQANQQRMQMPPASLSFLIQTLATQAIMSMSNQPHPVTGQVERDLDQAKHFIDMLEVLQTKTSGNRTPEESAFLDGALYELRMVFVEELRQG